MNIIAQPGSAVYIGTVMDGQCKGFDQQHQKQRTDEKAACAKHKAAAERVQHILHDHYAADNPVKAERIQSCASWLQIRAWSNGEKHLLGANFCGHRLCPMCAWRAHMRDSRILAEIMRQVGGYQSFVTLTIPSMQGITREIIRALVAEAGKFLRRRYGPDYITSIEVTHTAAGYHPHVHALICTPVHEGHGPEAVDALRQAWGRVWGRDYCLADIRPAQAGTEQELTKYLTKYSANMQAEVIRALADATYNLHLRAMAGAYRRLYKPVAAAQAAAAATEIEALNETYDWIDTIYQWMHGSYIPSL